jgi:hypothetical protein
MIDWLRHLAPILVDAGLGALLIGFILILAVAIASQPRRSKW